MVKHLAILLDLEECGHVSLVQKEREGKSKSGRNRYREGGGRRCERQSDYTQAQGAKGELVQHTTPSR